MSVDYGSECFDFSHRIRPIAEFRSSIFAESWLDLGGVTTNLDGFERNPPETHEICPTNGARAKRVID
jgi:hypothetical protein